MIAIDTNALIRLLIEDSYRQAKAVQEIVIYAENNSLQILILNEVLIETVWVLESVYKCTRKDISQFLQRLITASVYTFTDSVLISRAVHQYKKGGDFADLLIICQAKKNKVEMFFSFDKKLQKKFTGYVYDKLPKSAVLLIFLTMRV